MVVDFRIRPLLATAFAAATVGLLPLQASAFGSTNVYIDSASISKTGPATATVNGQISYNLLVTKGSPALAVNIEDTIPAGLIYQDGLSSSACDQVGTKVVCSWPASSSWYLLPSQEILNLTLAFVVSDSVGCQINNVATANAVVQQIRRGGTLVMGPVIIYDSNASNNTSNVTTTITGCTPPTDVTISKSGPSTAVYGDTLSYVVTAMNTSTTSAQNVRITDAIPAGLTFDPLHSTGGCTQQGTNVVCNIGTLTAGDSQSVTLAFTSSLSGACTEQSIINHATVTTSSIETNTSNNAAQVTTRFTCPAGCIDVIKQTFNPAGEQFSPVAQFTFHLDNQTIALNNAQGIARFTNVPQGMHVVTEDLPQSWLQLSVTPTNGSVYVPSGSTCAVVTFKNKQVLPQASSSSFAISSVPPQFGCIDIVKETFDPWGNPLPITAQFTFTLDGNRTAVNASNGRAKFRNVPVGSHTVTEYIPYGWRQVVVSPMSGTVNVEPGTGCAGIVFRNQQSIFTSSRASVASSAPSTCTSWWGCGGGGWGVSTQTSSFAASSAASSAQSTGGSNGWWW